MSPYTSIPQPPPVPVIRLPQEDEAVMEFNRSSYRNRSSATLAAISAAMAIISGLAYLENHGSGALAMFAISVVAIACVFLYWRPFRGDPPRKD